MQMKEYLSDVYPQLVGRPVTPPARRRAAKKNAPAALQEFHRRTREVYTDPSASSATDQLDKMVEKEYNAWTQLPTDKGDVDLLAYWSVSITLYS